MAISSISAQIPTASPPPAAVKPAQGTAAAGAAAPSTAASPTGYAAAAAAVKAISSAVQETKETPAQTLSEAESGDLQAKKLLSHGAPAQTSHLGSQIDTKA
jgi:hypothetical protein